MAPCPSPPPRGRPRGQECYARIFRLRPPYTPVSHFHRRARVRNLGIEGDDALEMAEQAESRPGRSQLAPTPAGAGRAAALPWAAHHQRSAAGGFRRGVDEPDRRVGGGPGVTLRAKLAPDLIEAGTRLLECLILNLGEQSTDQATADPTCEPGGSCPQVPARRAVGSVNPGPPAGHRSDLALPVSADAGRKLLLGPRPARHPVGIR